MRRNAPRSVIASECLAGGFRPTLGVRRAEAPVASGRSAGASAGRKQPAGWLFPDRAGNAGEVEFFIRKAIAWALREYAHTNAAAVRDFAAATPLSALSRREALKHLA